MKYIILSMFSIFLLSCKNDEKAYDNQQAIIEQEQVGSSVTGASEKLKNKAIDKTKSNLPLFSKQLVNSKYAFKSTVDSSYWYLNDVNGMIYDRSAHTITSDSLLDRLKSIDQQIISQNSIFLNSNYPQDSNTKYRGRIHEYIFAHDSVASSNYSEMLKLKQRYPMQWKVGVEWKSPSNLGLKENKIYHIVTDGTYMMGMEKEIQNLILY